MSPQFCPLRLAELHALPVVEAAFLRSAEFHAPGLVDGALGGGNMGLEFHPMGAGTGDGVDITMGRIETALMGLRHLGNNGASLNAGEQAHGNQATFARGASMGARPRLRHRAE